VDDESGVDGDFWRLTEASARTLFAREFPVDMFDVKAYGNVTVCSAFLYGLCAEEMPAGDLDRADPAFPLLIAIRAVKPEAPVSAATVVSGFSRTSSATNGPSAAILVYHRIAEWQPDSHGLCTPPEVFRAHMTHVRDQFQPMRLEDLVEAAAAGRIPEGAVAITLDDGYVDALNVASPILMDVGVPATFFINSERLHEEHERWWDMMERVFLSAATLPPTLELHVGAGNVRVPTGTTEQRAHALAALNTAAWPLGAEARRHLVRDVLTWSGIDAAPRATHRVLTAAEVRVLADRPGQTIGAHTTHHLALTHHPADVTRAEVFENKAALEDLMQRRVHLFSYPYGDFDAPLIGVVREAGFRAAVTVEAGLVRPGANRLLLPRCEVAAQHHRAFPQWLRGIFGRVATPTEH
jgi:peptidoglycan/xylan/chitin deacetylase (PgdA/CDA1 family)